MRIGRVLDISFDEPAMNLALEEAILDAVETGTCPSTLRFWESPCVFVVAGVGQVLRDVVDLDACLADNVPVQRRCSAGGCVVQGPGCLNYSLFLNLSENPEVTQLRPSYAYLAERLCAALRARGVHAEHAGTSDIAVDGLKVSGNAQKRRRRAILHHGTLLYALGPNAMEWYLHEPSERPAYREEREHRGFVSLLPFVPAALRELVREAYDAPQTASELHSYEIDLAATLCAEKYRDSAWIHRR